jgi:hypothetical protein
MLGTKVANTNTTTALLSKPIYELTMKAMRDIPFAGSLLEPQYDIFYNFRKKNATRTKAIADRRTAVALKHLPGRHNQQAHGRRGGMAGGSASSSASAFNTWNDREVAKMNKDLRDIVSADPVTYTAEQQKALRKLLSKNLPKAPIGDSYAIIVNSGMPFDTAMQIFGTQRKSSKINAQQLWMEHRVRDHYQEQNVRFSRMTKEEQDVVFDRLKDRVKANDPTLTTDDMDMLVTAGLYGHPQMRMDAFTVLKSAEPLSKQKRYVQDENGIRIPLDGPDVKYATPQGAYRYYSLEARLALTTQSAQKSYNLSQMPTSGMQFMADTDFFIREFNRTHVTDNTENVLGAAIQSHMSYVGPNADAPRPPSFYPRGVKTPEPNPMVVAYLQEQYRQTQANLSALGTTSTQLHRGTASDFRLGIPMSPWSDNKNVAFAYGDVVNNAVIPNKYVFMEHRQPRFNQTFDFEREWLILETGMMGKTKRRRIADASKPASPINKPAYELTVKAMHEIPFDGSLLEQQYDIFYNFREKPKVKRTKEVSSHVPPQSVRDAAKRGLALRSEFGRGGTAIGIARARDLSNGKGIPSPTIKRMVSFFARHAVDKRPDWANPSKPSNGYIAHLLWGGDAGRSWANKISRQINAERTKADDVTADGKPKRYSAGGGEVITGNLGRDSAGKFTNIRGAQALTQRVIMRGSGPKKKRGAGRAKLSPEQAKAQRDKIGKETIKKFGFSGDDYDALSNIGEEPISADSADTESVKKLIESNLAEMVGDVVALTTLGKRVLKVSQSGKAGAVREIIARDTAKREAQNKKRGEQNQSRVDKLNEQIASYEDKISDKKVKPRTRAIAERKLARAKAKLAELTTTKSRLKHLPGKHDQSKHGRQGRGGGGGSGIAAIRTPKVKPQTPSAVAGSVEPELMAYATKFAQETEALRRARLYDADGNYIATEEQRVAFHAELVARGEKLAGELQKRFGLEESTIELTFDPEVDAKYDEVVRTALRQPTNAPISFVMNDFPELQQVMETRVAPYVHMAPPDRKPVAIIEQLYGKPEGGYYTSVANGEESGFNAINLYGRSPDIAAHEYGHYIESEKVGSSTTMYDFTVKRMGKAYVDDVLKRAESRRYGEPGDITSPGRIPVAYPYTNK